MIVLRDIEKTFAVASGAVRALSGVNVTIERGEFVAIMGKSGSGKSTLLNVIGCLDRASRGRYELGGADVSHLDDAALSLLRGQRFGFIFQKFNLIGRNTARVNVEKPLVYQGVPPQTRRERALEMLERVGLHDRSEHRPSQLSGGQQQRVAIARALVTNPDILIADEPTGNLDTVTGTEIFNLLKRLNAEGRTLVMVTHDPDLARLAHRTLLIEDGVLA